MTQSEPNSPEVQGFSAFAALQSGTRSTRGRSWWARSWITAMTDSALAQEPLKRGRRYAGSGGLGPIAVSPGLVSSSFFDEDGEPAQVKVQVSQLDDTQWQRLLNEVSAHSGHLASLLDGEMPKDLIADADEVGVQLLPGIGDLDPECGCDQWELPCMHAAALCYQTAWLLDTDPFILLLLRGRGEQEIVGELRDRRDRPQAWVPGQPTLADARSAPTSQVNDHRDWPTAAGLDHIAQGAASWASSLLASDTLRDQSLDT